MKKYEKIEKYMERGSKILGTKYALIDVDFGIKFSISTF